MLWNGLLTKLFKVGLSGLGTMGVTTHIDNRLETGSFQPDDCGNQQITRIDMFIMQALLEEEVGGV